MTLDGAAVTVSVLVQAGSQREAALQALDLIEAACATVDCWLLGDLMRQTLHPALEGGAPAAAGPAVR